MEVVGNRTRVKVAKNKCAPPFRQAEFDIMYGQGISREGSVLDLAVAESIVKKSGAWYTYDGEQLGQGRENAKAFLQNNPELMVEISDLVWKAGDARARGHRCHGIGAAGQRRRLTITTVTPRYHRKADEGYPIGPRIESGLHENGLDRKVCRP